MIFRTQYEAEKHMVDSIIENFDFKRCKVAMNALGWVYFDTPTITEEVLIESAKKRLFDCIKFCKETKRSHFSPVFVSSGGLKATAWKNNYGHIISLELEFVLAAWTDDADY